MRSRGKLYRSRDKKILGGVASGLGEYFNIDPVIFRVLFVLFVFLDWFGLLAYVILWVVLPLGSYEEQVRESNS